MFHLDVRRTLLLTAAAVAACAPSAAAAPRAEDFSVRLGDAGRGAAAVQSVMPKKPFHVFGLRWRKAGDHAHVEARVRERGGRWRRWVEVPARHSARGSDPVWAGGARKLQLRVRGKVRGLRVDFVRVTRSRGVTAYAARAKRRQAPGQPAIVPRAEWGGDTQCPPRDTPSLGSVQMAFVHHTVNANDYGPQDSAAMVLGICRFHRNTNGWDDVGYNFLVDKYGTIFEGRAGGVDQPIVGAQAQGFNSVSTGVANLGTYESVPQTPEAMDAMARLLAWKLPLHGAPVSGRVTVTSAGGESNRYPSGRQVTFERISGHRDGNKTACPGAALYAQLPDLRSRASRVAPFVAPPPPAGQLTLAAVTQSLVYPEPARLSGVLTAPDGAPLSGEPVDVQVLTARGFKTKARTVSGDGGAWSAELGTRRSRVVRAVARTSPRPVISARLAVQVAPVVTARTRARRVRAGRRLVVRGTVRPGKRRLLVEALRIGNDGEVRGRALRWRIGARKGRFRAAVPLVRPGLYRVRVRFTGNRRHSAARTGDMYVRAVR